MILNKKKFDKLSEEGLLYHRQNGNLHIYNYTQTVQFDKKWDKFTMMARGLILRDDGYVVARPFPKFFNMGERENTMIKNLPITPYEVSEKLDGCLLHSTTLALWNGGTITIGEIVNKKISPILIGKNKEGKLVPTKILDWFNNGTKDNWLEVTVDCLPSWKAGCRTGNKLKITTNHEVFANNNLIRAGQLKIGDQMLNFERVLDDRAKHVVESGLLGDGSLSKTHNSYCYSEGHAQKQFALTKHVAFLLGSAGRVRSNTMSGFGSKIKWAGTLTLKSLKNLREKWYPNGKKSIPKDLSWIDDFTIAKWYMDDGSLAHNKSQYQNDRALFATNCFKHNDVIRLAKLLEKKYKVKTTIYDSKGWTIRINSGLKNQIDNFWASIAPYIIEELRYKLPKKFRKIKHINLNPGGLIILSKQVSVLSIKKIPLNKSNFPSGRTGFDIKTETGNYFAKGVLVHNSLGILYKDKDGYKISTRGVFDSEQAIWATKWLKNHGGDKMDWKENITYLFEIIHPLNRIVVDYGDRSELVLIGLVHNWTGHIHPYKEVVAEAKRLGFSHPKMFSMSISEIEKKAKESKDNEEGFVILYPDNQLMVKVKLEDYVRLHRLTFGISVKAIWENMMEGKNIEKIFEDAPDEVYDWIKNWKNYFRKKEQNILATATEHLNKIKDMETRKEQALYLQKEAPQFLGIVFSMIDNKPYLKGVYNLFKPAITESTQTFRYIKEELL